MILNWSFSYKRAFKKLAKNNDELGSWACSIEYDLRIIFDFIKNPDSNDTEILLIDIGTHDEVY